MYKGILFFIFVCISIVHSITLNAYLTTKDYERLKGIFQTARPFTDIATTHYGILGDKLLLGKVADAQDACNFIKSKVDLKNLESLYHAASVKKLTNCQIAIAGAQKVLEASFKDDASAQDIYYAALAMYNFELPIDSAKVTKALQAALKRDDSVLNLGYAFHVASVLTGDVTSFFERIEDVVVQADEVNSKQLQFEGGLSITATIVSGIYRLAETHKKAPTLTGEQAVKFTNYFLSRKYVQTVKGASLLLDILQILTTNKYHIPVAITLDGSTALSVQNPVAKVRITNVLGKGFGPLTVTADSAKRMNDDAVVISKKTFQAVQGDDSLYALNFMETKPPHGFYTVAISCVPSKADPRLVGNTGAQVSLKVMTDISVENVEIGTVDKDQGTQPKTIKVEYGKKISTPVEADFLQKLLMKLTLKDKVSGKIMTAHQVFVQLTNKLSKQEIIFVAEPETSGAYKFDLDISAKAKDFGHLSGSYDVAFIVGDPVIANPFIWSIGEVILTFPQGQTTVPKKEDPYAPKPEIVHMFRVQEKRPSLVVSNTFSFLVMAPLLILLLLWAKIGISCGNFKFSLSAVVFFASLAATFALFAMFWFKMDMFTTLKCLSGLAVITFLSGHSVLSTMGKKKE